MSDATMTAIATALNVSASVREVKNDPVVSAVVKSFLGRSALHADVDATRAEIRAFRSLQALPTFNMEGTDGLEAAAEWRVVCRNDRVRCLALMDDLRDITGRVKRMMRVLKPHLREILSAQPAKAADEIIAVALDPIFSSLEDYKDLMVSLSEAIDMIDETRSTLDALFNLHKQHVFITAATYDPEKERPSHKKGNGFKKV